jgi:hypothetical protein
MRQLEEYQCLVLESGFKQKLSIFRAPHPDHVYGCENLPNESLISESPENIHNPIDDFDNENKKEEEHAEDSNLENLPKQKVSNNVLTV